MWIIKNNPLSLDATCIKHMNEKKDCCYSIHDISTGKEVSIIESNDVGNKKNKRRILIRILWKL